MVIDQGFRWPVVGVRICKPRSTRGGSPRGPTKEGCQLPDLLGVADGVRPEAELCCGISQEIGVVRLQLNKRVNIPLGERHLPEILVVSVGREVRNRLCSCLIGPLSVLPKSDQCRPVQIIGSEIWTEICAMSKDGAILHEPVTQKHRL